MVVRYKSAPPRFQAEPEVRKPGPKKGYKKTGGRAKGTPNKKTVVRADILEKAFQLALATLTPKQVEKVTPMVVWQLALSASVKARNMTMALVVARDYAPYVHRKLSPILVDDEAGDIVVRVVGGLPEVAPTVLN